MGNLLACFGAPKKGRRRKLSFPEHPVCERYAPPQGAKDPVKRVAPASAADGGISRRGCKDMHTVASRHNSSDDIKQLDFDGSKQPASNSFKKVGTNSPKKKVTFDMNVQTYESAPTCEHQILLEDTEDQDEELKKGGKKEEEKPQKAAVATYPPNHRYQNCESSDDENDEDDDGEECDGEDELDSNMDDECDNLLQEEESFNSYFSKNLDIDCKKLGDSYSDTNSVSSPLDTKPYHLENQSARDRSNYVHPALNPVENLSQWKQVKAGKVAPKQPMKENINATPEKKLSKSPELAFPNTKHPKSFNWSFSSDESSKQEVSVDASLSSWLTPPGNVKGSEEVRCSPQMSDSRSNTTSLDERPILGALTVDDLKHANSMTPSPKKSPSNTPDETPIVGSVGRYWNHANQETCLGSPCLDSATKGIPNTTSKYSEEKQVNWHSTPFEVRLERALKKGSVGTIPMPCVEEAFM